MTDKAESAQQPRYRPETLTRFCRDVLVQLGMLGEDAQLVADSLVQAELEGNGSHGVSRLAIYTRRMREGRIRARPEIHINRDGATLRVDGGDGPGQIVSHRAVEAALPVARELGIAGVTVRRSNHFGTASYYCQMACRQGLALIATTNSPPGIAPWGGRSAYFGTNPIAFGFPRHQEPHLVVDMSSSVVARGNIMLAAREEREIPEGWAMDAEGVPTTDASAALEGAMLPLGGTEGGAKGYALAMAVEVLSGVLSGAAFGPHINNLYREGDPPADVGHCFILLDPARWLPEGGYYVRMEQFLDEIKAVPLARGAEEILYPGERRYRKYLENCDAGVELPEAVRHELRTLGNGCGVAFP